MTMNHHPAIALEEVTKTYGSVTALDKVSLEVAPGEWLALMGPSGSGKTTLVNLIGCLDRPTAGAVRIFDGRGDAGAGTDTRALSRRALTRFRAAHVGLVFQQFHLVPYLTALENVMLAQYFHSLADAPEARRSLDAVGLAARADHLPSQLSGGEQQRVCIARALINDPAIILADEPTGNLDEDNEAAVLDLLRAAHASGRTIVMVTHDPATAALAGRCVHLRHGRILASQQAGATVGI
jgi:putative ABC transport system ATP-binding protein